MKVSEKQQEIISPKSNMQSKKLHISEVPIREWMIDSSKPAIRPTIYGKPRGLWYATGLEWVDRMTKVEAWGVTEEHENFPYTRAIYNKVEKQNLQSVGILNELNYKRAAPRSGRPHYVYDLTIDPSLYSEDIHHPSREKMLLLTPSSLEQLYKEFYIPFQEKYIREQHHAGLLAGLESSLSHARIEYYTFKKDEDKMKLYGKLLKYLYDTKQLTKLMMKRYEGKDSGEIQLDSDKYKTILLDNMIAGKLPIEGFLYDTFLRIWGNFWNDLIRKEWGGIDFSHALFKEEYQKQHPEFGFLKYVEIPSGVYFKPLIDKVPKLLFVLSVSTPSLLRDTIQKTKEKLLEVYSEEDTADILEKRMFVAVPTKEGEIRFMKVSDAS
jgi:hypothetical protein